MLPSEFGLVQLVIDELIWVKMDIFKKIWIRLLILYYNKRVSNVCGNQLIALNNVSLKRCIIGSNLINRIKICTKRHILTDKKKNSIISSYIISKHSQYKSSNKDVIDNAVVLKQRSYESSFTKNKIRKRYHHLSLDRSI